MRVHCSKVCDVPAPNAAQRLLFAELGAVSSGFRSHCHCKRGPFTFQPSVQQTRMRIVTARIVQSLAGSAPLPLRLLLMMFFPGTDPLWSSLQARAAVLDDADL